MNLLLTTSSFPRWSNDTEPPNILNFAENLNKYGKINKLIVLSPHHKGAKKEERLNGIKIFRFQYFFSFGEKLAYEGSIVSNIINNKSLLLLVPLFLVSQIIRIADIVKKEKIDIIQANWLIPQGLAAVIYKLFNRNIKIVCTVRGGDIYKLNNVIFKKIKNFVFNRCDAVIAVSRPLKRFIEKNYIVDTNLKVINNGVDIDLFSPQPKNNILAVKYKINSFCLLFVGRLTRVKGVDYLIEAIAEIKKIYPEIKLLIIGEGPERQRLESKATNLDIRNNVDFLGAIDNRGLPAYYNLADIYIGPSALYEGFGIVFIEAMACGLPVVATSIGGISDIVENNKNGILIPPKEKKAIVDAVLFLLNNKEKRRKYGIEGRQKVVNKFSWENIIHSYAKVYLDIRNN